MFGIERRVGDDAGAVVGVGGEVPLLPPELALQRVEAAQRQRDHDVEDVGVGHRVIVELGLAHHRHEVDVRVERVLAAVGEHLGPVGGELAPSGCHLLDGLRVGAGVHAVDERDEEVGVVLRQAHRGEEAGDREAIAERRHVVAVAVGQDPLDLGPGQLAAGAVRAWPPSRARTTGSSGGGRPCGSAGRRTTAGSGTQGRDRWARSSGCRRAPATGTPRGCPRSGSAPSTPGLHRPRRSGAPRAASSILFQWVMAGAGRPRSTCTWAGADSVSEDIVSSPLGRRRISNVPSQPPRAHGDAGRRCSPARPSTLPQRPMQPPVGAHCQLSS